MWSRLWGKHNEDTKVIKVKAKSSTDPSSDTITQEWREMTDLGDICPTETNINTAGVHRSSETKRTTSWEQLVCGDLTHRM